MDGIDGLLNCIIKLAQLEESERRNENNDLSVWGFEIVLSMLDRVQNRALLWI